MEISERVEELTNCLSDLCQDYHVPSPPVELCPRTTYQLHPETVERTSGEDSNEQEFVEFCQKHPVVHRGTHTLPLPRRRPPPPPPNMAPLMNTAALKSQSHEGLRNCSWSNITPAHPANLIPFHNTLHPHDHDTRNYYFKTTSYQDNAHHSRPLSYQEISYDENDFEETNILGLEDTTWAELSCP